MNLPCDIIMDLVSTYKDHIASETTTAEIEEHLKECPSCRKYYKMYDTIDSKVGKAPVPAPETDSFSDYNYSDVSARLRKKKKQNLAIMSIIAGTATTLTAVNIIKLIYKSKN